MSSISESTRTVRHVVLPLTADNLHRYEYEKEAIDAHKRTYADEERGSSSDEASRTSFADSRVQPNHQEEPYITSFRRSTAVNEETQADDEDDYRQRSTDLATPKARDVIKAASAGRTGTTVPLSLSALGRETVSKMPSNIEKRVAKTIELAPAVCSIIPLIRFPSKWDQ